MDYQKIFDDIAHIKDIEDLDLDKVKNCMQSEDFLIRCDTIQVLSQFVYNEEVAQIIIAAIFDKNYLVRCEVYEALEKTENNQMIMVLYKRLKTDRSSTARMYAITTILILMKKYGYSDDLVEKLRIAFAKEKVKLVNLAYLALFYYVEKDIKYINKLLTYLDDENYYIRCNVINILSQVLDSKNIEIIKNAYKQRYVIESTRVVKLKLEKYL